MRSEWKQVVAEWQGDLRFEGKNLNEGHVLMGTKDDKASISPMELLLIGLAGCTGMDVIHILEKKRQKVEKFQVHVRGQRADEYPKVYTHIEIEYVLEGPGLSPDAVEQAIRLSENKYCSASAMLSEAAEIHSSYRIIPAMDES